MTVLYRTYRPRKFSEVIGQENIVAALEGAIRNKKVSHAYLFSGSRGTGKTSVARILAGELGVKDEDVYEIDAASNRGIDDIREIREHVSVLPFSSPYKVYIVDEVHMLTKEAFNALLKTLEEPPAHVVFILATTELHKVPDTIISRCQTFAFKKPARDIIRAVIEKVAKKEGYALDRGAADLIALLGDGSFRDALGMLDKVIGMSADKKISLEEVSIITGAPKTEIVNSFIDSLISRNEEAALKTVNAGAESGISMSIFVSLVLEKVRFIFLLQHAPGMKQSVGERVSAEDLTFISNLAAKKTVTPAFLSSLLEAADAIPRSHIESLPLEMAVVRICEKN